MIDIPTTKRVAITMRMPFASFDQDMQSEFAGELARLIGCAPADFTGTTLRPGCVIWESDLDVAALERLLLLYRRAEDGSVSPKDLLALESFIEAYKISDIKETLAIKVQIKTSRKVSDAKPLVVLVHGWNGSEKSFGQMPRHLREMVDCTVNVYPYSSAFWGHSPALVHVAGNFHSWVSRRAESGCRIAFIAHSYGGLVVRKLILMQAGVTDSFAAQVRSITFIASPYSGAELAKVATLIDRGSEQLKELMPDSSALYELNTGWERWVAQHVPSQCRTRSLFGTNDKVVNAENARGLDLQAVPILGADHRSIVDCAGKDDEVLQNILGFLKQAGFAVRFS